MHSLNGKGEFEIRGTHTYKKKYGLDFPIMRCLVLKTLVRFIVSRGHCKLGDR
jgi:hypothetical protein